jgi:type I restriction enzyme S subunit
MRIETNNSEVPTIKSELPEGWRWMKLEQICTVHPGQHILEAYYNREGVGIGYLTGPDDFGKIYPSIKKWTQRPKAWCQPGDILVTVKGAGVGKTNLAPEEKVAIGRQLMAVRPNANIIDQLFLYNYIVLQLSGLQKRAMGSTVPGLSRGDIEKINIPLPPFPEQRRIAAKIQELMQDVERARAACEKQLEASKVLPAAYLREVFESKEATNWQREKLGEVCEVVTGSTPRTDDLSNWDGDILWATPNDMGKLAGFTIDDTERKITEKGFKSCSTKLLPFGSVLLTTRAPIGHLAINLKPICTNQGFKSLIPSSQLDGWFLFFYLKYSVPKLQSMGRGQTFTEISKKQVEDFEIRLPQIDTQHRIALGLKEKMAHLDKLLLIIRKNQYKLNDFPQAILREAFMAKL